MGWYPNSHDTYPTKKDYDSVPVEPCPYNGLDSHNEHCTLCKGKGEFRYLLTALTIEWGCYGCGMEGPREVFENSSCLGIGAGFYEERRAHHELGEHDDVITSYTVAPDGTQTLYRSSFMEYDDCPLCLERRAIGRKLVNVITYGGSCD